MNIFAVRHGQTEWNVARRICGISDIALTSRGIEQARTLAASMGEVKIDLILSSPLIRARHTAEILSDALGVAYVVDDRLREQNYGKYEGVMRDDAGFLEAKKHFPSKLSGGESVLQVAQRVYNVLDEIIEKYKGQHVLLVSHGGICRVIHSYFHEQSNEEYYNFHTGNCELRSYEVKVSEV
ncbi:histidine phosphatase family protein [Paenibacillus sp. CF384]|uniref:histidine phosphatase family protein n=1 Tax=Paenibacillus sp. CF384 TaxID=1884382 RepID=UPI00089C3079|nr:histidine phosphatase family protein [Paenibacillus sp. CF384]SDW78887.1 probable phosphoglycerate mutase [Paenibacillus sp. CF384]